VQRRGEALSNRTTEESNMASKRKLAIGFAMFGLVMTFAVEVLAVVGRPLTPVSYAGVARRTVRRASYYP
jgi:hypothetical protein